MSGWLYCRNRNLGSNCTWTKIGLDLQNIKVSVMVFQQAQYSSTASINLTCIYCLGWIPIFKFLCTRKSLRLFSLSVFLGGQITCMLSFSDQHTSINCFSRWLIYLSQIYMSWFSLPCQIQLTQPIHSLVQISLKGFLFYSCKADQNAWCFINVIFPLEIDNFSLNGQIVPPFL